MPTHEIARLRIAQSPEGRRIFPRMSVAENLQMGADATDRSEAERASGLERIFALFPRLKERMTQRGGTLSGGEQQMLAIGRALMSRPRLLMLDEPSLGLAPLIARQIFDAIRTLNRQDGLTVLIVEQNANHALKLAHRGYVMVNGLITLSGTGSELLQRPEIRAAYLRARRRRIAVVKERMTQRGGTLSGGEQQMLAIGRALMSRPRLLMLDEPSLGLAPLIARQIFDAIRTLNRQDGLTVLIVEQNANHALKLAHRGYVMVNGLITLSGTGSELLQRPEIRAAYLEGGRRVSVHARPSPGRPGDAPGRTTCGKHAAKVPWICPKIADDFAAKSADNGPDFRTRRAGCFP